MTLQQAIESYKVITNQPNSEARIVGDKAEFLGVSVATNLCNFWVVEAIITEYQGQWVAITNKGELIEL
jgi:hypothetical protein